MFASAKAVRQRGLPFTIGEINKYVFGLNTLFNLKSFSSVKSKSENKTSPFIIQAPKIDNNSYFSKDNETAKSNSKGLGLKSKAPKAKGRKSKVNNKEVDITSNPTSLITNITNMEEGAISEPQEISSPKSEEKKSSSPFIVKPKSMSGIRAREIHQIQNLMSIESFLTKPQNITLSLNERVVIYDKLCKILLGSKDDYKKGSTLAFVLTKFLEKFSNALQAAQNEKVYISLLNMPTPRVLFWEFNKFYADCLNELLFKYPELKAQVRYFSTIYVIKIGFSKHDT